MRIITVNLNGIRAATKKGFFEWLEIQNADVVCFQEARIQPDQLTDGMIAPKGFESAFEYAVKKGYSGVGLYFNKTPDRIQIGIGWENMDSEGRFIMADYGNLSIISLYLPSGSSGGLRQDVKYKMMAFFEKWLLELKKTGREIIVCGDWNIAHKQIDLKNWKSNQKNSGFLPEERDWMTKLYDEFGFVDVFRTLNQEVDQYTWWSNRGQAWANNVGWRLDYQVSTPGIASKATAESIFKTQRFSDHAPLIIDYEHQL